MRFFTSLKKNRTGILIMLCSSVFVCFGQLFWKLAANGNILVLLGGFCLYGIGAMLMLIAYQHGSLSVLQPVLCLNYTLSILLAALILTEKITSLKIAGIAVITLGVVLIGGGDD